MNQFSSSHKMPVIADVDTGVDDALALLYLAQAPEVDLLAVTCVAGNTHVDQVVSNTLQILEAAGRTDVPVGRGAEQPLLEPARDAHDFHGVDGLAGLADPGAARTTNHHALELLRATILDSAEPVSIIGLAPLTNIALLLRAFPDVAKNIARVLFMGGSGVGGNATATAEFNAWHDPEALAIVLDSDIDVTMYGLDVFYEATVDEAEVLALRGGDTAAKLAAELLVHLHDLDEDGEPVPAGAALGDAGAACLAVNASLGQAMKYPVRVELAGSVRGQTTVDRRIKLGEDHHHGLQNSSREIHVVERLDQAAVQKQFLDVFSYPQLENAEN